MAAAPMSIIRLPGSSVHGRGMMAGSLLSTIVNMTILSSIPETTHAQRRKNVLEQVLNESTYDPRIPPNFEDSYPTEITVQLYVLSIDSVDESSMEFSMSIYLRQNWTDKRLQWEDKENLTRIEIDTKRMGDIWMPDLYFVNEKEAIMHDVTVPNRLLHLYPNGNIQSSIRISMTLSCDMYLQKYPHDQQTCEVGIGSYSYTSENVVFNWHSYPIIMREGMTLPRFDVEFQRAKRCEHIFYSASMILGNFTCITAEFELTRLFGYYVAQVYVPSVLIVVLSWVSFWIDIDAIPARVSLGLLTVLTMTTQSTGARNALPQVSYVKAIDVWMAMCLVFVFAALLEFAYVNVQARVEKRRRESVMGEKDTNGHLRDDDKFRNKEVVSTSRRMVYLQDRLKRQRARMADKVSRVVFPIMFAVFNLIYWLVYCL